MWKYGTDTISQSEFLLNSQLIETLEFDADIFAAGGLAGWHWAGWQVGRLDVLPRFFRLTSCFLSQSTRCWHYTNVLQETATTQHSTANTRSTVHMPTGSLCLSFKLIYCQHKWYLSPNVVHCSFSLSRLPNGSILAKDLAAEYNYLEPESIWFYNARTKAQEIIDQNTPILRGGENGCSSIEIGWRV